MTFFWGEWNPLDIDIDIFFFLNHETDELTVLYRQRRYLTAGCHVFSRQKAGHRISRLCEPFFFFISFIRRERSWLMRILTFFFFRMHKLLSLSQFSSPNTCGHWLWPFLRSFFWWVVSGDALL